MTEAPFPSGDDVVFHSTTLRGNLVGTLADLSSAENDIRFARAALLRLEALPQPEQENFDVVLERALWNSAHVALARPFMGRKRFLQAGGRIRLDDIRATLSAEHEATLAEALEVRNRHVAHSVNSREAVIVHADFLPPELGGSFHGVGLLHITNNSDRVRVPPLLDLTQALLDGLEAEEELAFDAVLADVKAREPELRAAASVRPEVDVRQTRA